MGQKVLGFVTLLVISVLNLGSTTDSLYEESVFKQRILQQVERRLPERYKEFAGEITQTLLKESVAAGIDPVLILAIISTESSFNPAALGLAGEIGLMQIKPSTAEAAAKKLRLHYAGSYDLWSPTFNITFGIRYLGSLKSRFNGPQPHFISAYNLGSRAVKNLLRQNVEPQIYRSRVVANYRAIYKDIFSAENVQRTWNLAGY